MPFIGGYQMNFQTTILFTIESHLDPYKRQTPAMLKIIL